MSTFSKPGAVVALTLAKNSDINDLSDAVEEAFALLPDETLLENGATNYAVSAGAGNAYIVTMPTTLAAYVDGYEVVFKANHTNTGASTVNVDSVGVKSLRRQNGTALAAGDIQSGKIVSFRYNSTSGYLEMQLLAAGDMVNVETVAGIVDDVTTVAGVAASVPTVAGIDTETVTVAGIASAVSSVAAIDIAVLAVAAIDSEVVAVALDLAGADTIGTVAADLAGADTIGTVAGVAANVTTVAGVAADVTTVAGVAANVTTVAGVAADVTTVAGVAASIPTVAAIDTSVSAVAAIDSAVSTVAGSIADVQTVADMTTLLETTEKAADYTLALADVGKIVAMNKTGAAALTVPTNAAVAFPVGSVVGVYNISSDDVTIAGSGGVTVRNAGDLPQYGEVSLRKRAENEWVLVGDVV